jgi:hypothetical protein
MEIEVDLPAPFGPSSPKHSPLDTARSSRRTASCIAQHSTSQHPTKLQHGVFVGSVLSGHNIDVYVQQCPPHQV